ncbi:ribonuclease inhibitor-like, partial [Heptranchias perlo]|uniref:ribonuclease inhibitor-like n=1 Tax=Heptranchias perlo TaxID=212740 RepID=UPI00355A6EDA
LDSCLSGVSRLCGNRLTDSCCEELASVISANPRLASLDLGNNELTDCGLASLYTQLGKRECRLERLGLRNNQLTSESGQILASGIAASWTLTHLDLNDNSLEDSGLSHLYPILGNPNCKIQVLKLESNNLTAGCCEGLASALSQHWTVRDLHLNFNTFQDSGLESLLGKMVNPACHLHTLRLSDTNLTSRSGSALADALRSNPDLNWLDISNNDLGNDGAEMVFKALAEPKCQIEKLWLQSTSLTWASCEALANFLRVTHTLTMLFLKDNKIGDQGVKIFSSALKESYCQLQALRLDGTGLTDDCMEDLTAALSTKQSLTELTLPYNSISDASINALSQFITSSPNLREIRLRANKFTSEGNKRLESLGSSRPGLIVSVGH